MAKSTPDFISQIPLFHGLSNRQKKQLSKRFVSRTYKNGEKMVTQGKGGAGMFTIVSGHAQAVLESAGGEGTVVNSFGPGDFFGEIALLDDGPRTASVVATEDTDVLILSRPEFIAVMANDAEMGLVISQELARRIRTLIQSLGITL
jgi:CRP/FNR family cyclic AMP-dependent transcriptional regulator